MKPEIQCKELRNAFEHHLRRTLAKDRYTATTRDRYYAFALAVRDRLIERWIPTQQTHHNRQVKRIYYLSLEFLIGRSLEHNVMNLRLEEACRQAVLDVGLELGRPPRTGSGCGPGQWRIGAPGGLLYGFPRHPQFSLVRIRLAL